MSLFVMPLLIAAAPLPVCDTPARIVAAARVTPLPTDSVASDMGFAASDLSVQHAVSVRWSGCALRLASRVDGDRAITETGVPVAVSGDGVVVDDRPLYPADPEPAHPEIAGARFVSSTSLSADRARAGLWHYGDGRYGIAVYRPGEPDPPRMLIHSAVPLLGVAYLGAPDAIGGRFTLWQRLPGDIYRVLTVMWREEGLRRASRSTAPASP